MKLDVRTAIVLTHHEDENLILLLRRSESKKLFPGLITGIGGKVELEQDEGEDLEKSLLREFSEETNIPLNALTDIKLRLSLIVHRGEQLVILLWYTGKLMRQQDDLSCTEGTLDFYRKDDLPEERMIPTARAAIPFICSLPHEDERVHTALFTQDEQLITY